MINKTRLIKLTRDLIRINSENPPGNEAAIARFVHCYCRDIGLRSRIYEFRKNRSNVVAVLEAKKGAPALLVSPHLDTVPRSVNSRKPPFKAVIEGDRLYGLGATDCKGNLAAVLEAIRSIVEQKAKLEYNIIMAATADEESGSVWGLQPLLDKKILRPQAAVIVDADDFEVIVAQKGLIHLKVKIYGKRAHGAYPYLGDNAISRAVDALGHIRKLKFAYKRHRYLRSPTLNIGTIKGGEKVNIVADYCEYELDIRFLPGMEPADILGALDRTLESYAGRFKIEFEGLQPAYSISRRHALVWSLSSAIRRVGAIPRIAGSEGATVISFFKKLNIPAVATGFGAKGMAHATDEYARISVLYKGSRALEDFFKTVRLFETGR